MLKLATLALALTSLPLAKAAVISDVLAYSGFRPLR